jgi:hypothetical protein
LSLKVLTHNSEPDRPTERELRVRAHRRLVNHVCRTVPHSPVAKPRAADSTRGRTRPEGSGHARAVGGSAGDGVPSRPARCSSVTNGMTATAPGPRDPRRVTPQRRSIRRFAALPAGEVGIRIAPNVTAPTLESKFAHTARRAEDY